MVSDPWELELLLLMSHIIWVLGSELWSSGKTMHALIIPEPPLQYQGLSLK